MAYADTYDRENILKSPSLPGDDFSQAQELVRDLVPENTRPMVDHPLWKHAQKSDARERKDYPVRPGTELTHSIKPGVRTSGNDGRYGGCSFNRGSLLLYYKVWDSLKVKH